MDWNDLRYLLALHRRKSLAAAAKELKVTKATASRRLAALERALGTRLVERKPSGLVLTKAGQDVIATATGIDSALGLLEGRLASASDASPRGTVRLTAPPWLAARLLIPALPDLAREYPELEVRLVSSDHMLNLAQRDADLAIRNVRPEHKSLVARKIIDLGGCVYASTLYLERRGRPTSRSTLRGHDVLVYDGLGGMPGFEWLREPTTGAKVAFRADGPEALIGAATAGLGLCAVPCLLGDAEPTLVRVDALGFSRCSLFLVTHEEIQKTPRIRAVSDLVVKLLRQHCKAIEG